MENEQTYTEQLNTILRSNTWFLQVLMAVRECNPPDWLLGAGVIRNIVWDHLHGFSKPTPIEDVDVVFFDPNDLRPQRDLLVQQQLIHLRPDIPWEATNQAAVHLWYEESFGFPVPPLHSSEEAVATWPETATSVAVRLLANDEIYVAAPCGLSDLFNLLLRRNPRRVTRAIFLQRLQKKQTLRKWPRVTLIDDEP